MRTPLRAVPKYVHKLKAVKTLLDEPAVAPARRPVHLACAVKFTNRESLVSSSYVVA